MNNKKQETGNRKPHFAKATRGKQETRKKSFFSIFTSIFSPKDKGVVVRIAPSPTGNLHIGTARSALFNYLYAKQNNGKFVLRIEDTDKERSKKEYEENIKEGLEWLGIKWDEFYRQSDRSEIYKKYIEKLVKENKAYISKEEPKEEGKRSEVIRFRNPNKKIRFEDTIRGEIEFDTTELGDFVIAKSIDEPLYHMAVVVDDFDMGINHIIRGEDGISNTPRQILIQEAIGAPRPKYTHMPLILNKDRSKLSKRDGVVPISEYKDIGYLPEAFINFLAMLGWAPKDDKEIFSMKELVENFRLEDIQKSAAVFNLQKLDWFNKEWIKKMDDKEIISIILKNTKIDEDLLNKALPEIKERVTKLDELKNIFDRGGEFDYLISLPDYEIKKINWKENTSEITLKHLNKVLEILNETETTDTEKIKDKIWPYADEVGRGDVLWPTRFALSGKEKSIDPFTLIHILGKEESIKRIQNAIQKIN